MEKNHWGEAEIIEDNVGCGFCPVGQCESKVVIVACEVIISSYEEGSEWDGNIHVYKPNHYFNVLGINYNICQLCINQNKSTIPVLQFMIFYYWW